MTLSTSNKIEATWLQHWKETLGNPRQLPRKVLRAYLDLLDISADMLVNQMNRECWLVDAALEDFGQDECDEVAVDL